MPLFHRPVLVLASTLSIMAVAAVRPVARVVWALRARCGRLEEVS